jgi:hypothetical protein
VEQVEQVSERTWMVTYKVKEEYVLENDCSNVVIAIWFVYFELWSIFKNHWGIF